MQLTHDELLALLHGHAQHFAAGGAVRPSADPMAQPPGGAPPQPNADTGQAPVMGGPNNQRPAGDSRDFTGAMSQFGNWIGNQVSGVARHFAPYQVDPNSFNMPGFGTYQGMSQSGAANALGGQANQFRDSQADLVGMLTRQARGEGPSVAQQQLGQTTQGNIANAYAMAQAANPNDAGAMRNISNQVSNINQQAVGQGALLRAQEQMNAQGLLGNAANAARGQDMGQFQMNNQAALGWANLGQQGANDQLQAQIAEQQLKQKADEDSKKGLGGFIGGIGSGLESLFKGAHGGLVPGYSGGGQVGGGGAGLAHFGLDDTSKDDAGDSIFGFQLAQGGSVPSPAFLAAVGGKVPGQAEMEGDHAENDTVPATLSPGEVVLPRSVTQSPDAPDKAAEFMRAVRSSKPPKLTFKDVLESHRHLHQRLARIEALYCGGVA